MSLLVVLQHPGWLAKSAQGSEVLDPLIPWNSLIGIISHNKNRCLNFVSKEKRGVLDIELRSLPKGLSNPALCMLILELANHSRAPADSAISTCHISNRSTCTCSFPFKYLRLSDHIGNLITTPALPLNRDIVPVNPRIFTQLLNARYNAVESTLSRMANLVIDIRYKYKITVTCKVCYVDSRAAWSRSPVIVQIVTCPFVEIDNHRILFGRIKILRFMQDSV